MRSQSMAVIGLYSIAKLVIKAVVRMSKKRHQKPEVLHRSVVAQSRLFTVESMEIRFGNGVERTYERLVSGGAGAVMVVALFDNEQLALVREYGGGIDDYSLTLPKGAIDMGESIAMAARRELQEEIGYDATELVYLKELTSSPSYMNSSIHLVLARGLYESRLEGDEPEPLELVTWPMADLSSLYAQDDFHEGRAVAAIGLA
jgi:ADP-ribose diphosphatase